MRLRAAHAALGDPAAATAEIEAIAAAVARCPPVLLDARAALIHAADALEPRAPAVAGAARKRLAELGPSPP